MIRNIIAKFIFRHYFKLVLEEEILRFDPKTNSMYFNGNKLSQEKVSSLGEQARLIQSTELWGLMIREMQYLANDKIFNKSLTMNDTLGGKFILYTLDIMSKKVYNISKQK